MTPAIEPYHLIVFLFWLAMAPIAAFLLTVVTGYFTGESPETWGKALGTVVLVAAVVFFTYDASGYFFFLMMQDPQLGIQLPPGYTYWNWLMEPTVLKWHVLGIVPIVRFLPVVFAFCAGGTIQVFLWTVPYRVGVVVFVVETFLCLVAMALLSFVFSLGLRAYEWAFEKPAGHGGAVAERVEEGGGPPGRPEKFSHLAHRVRQQGPERDTFWHRANAEWESVNQHLQPLYGVLEPVTRHLPMPAQDFLNGGGWPLVLGGLVVLIPLWPRVHRRRHHLHHKKHPHPHAPAEPHDQLAVIGDALTGLGPSEATVHGVPARLRLVVLAPARAGGAKVTTDMAAGVLDAVLPGLAGVAAYDAPRVEVWDDARPRDHFRQAFLQRVEVPEPPGAPSRWVLLDGEAPAVHVGLALYADAATTRREVAVAAGHWSEVLGLRAVPVNERD
jgi:hypothetical protein